MGWKRILFIVSIFKLRHNSCIVAVLVLFAVFGLLALPVAASTTSDQYTFNFTVETDYLDEDFIKEMAEIKEGFIKGMGLVDGINVSELSISLNYGDKGSPGNYGGAHYDSDRCVGVSTDGGSHEQLRCCHLRQRM